MTWGHPASLPDPEPDQHEQKKGKGIARRGRRSGKQALFFVGSLEPLLLACRQKKRRRWSASFDPNGGQECEEDEAGNINLDTDTDADPGTGADADGDTDDGIWPGEFVVPTSCRLSSSLSPKRSRRFSGRGSHRRKWSVLLVLH